MDRTESSGYRLAVASVGYGDYYMEIRYPVAPGKADNLDDLHGAVVSAFFGLHGYDLEPPRDGGSIRVDARYTDA